MNQWLNKMERKLGRDAVPKPMNYVDIHYGVDTQDSRQESGAMI
mgnify:CR=1 FL=1